MDVQLFQSKTELGKAAATFGAAAIRSAIETNGRANIVVATGASQFEILEALVNDSSIDWSKVTGFHLDEYIGMPDTHPASFRRYLRERFTSKLPTLGAFHFVDGDAADLGAELKRVSQAITAHPIDVTFAGIGENGHLAFNDPPADFDTDGALYRRVAGREMPPPAIRRRLVSDLRGCAADRHLHERPPDHEEQAAGAVGSRMRARRMRCARRWKGRSATCARRPSFSSTRPAGFSSTTESASKLSPGFLAGVTAVN